MNDVRIPLRNIGNSRGIIIPSSVLKQCSITDEVELEVEDGRVILEPLAAKRVGWFDNYDPKDDVSVFPDTLDVDTIDDWVWE